MHTMSRQNNTTVQILQTKKLQNGGISVGSSSAEKKSAVENHTEAEITDCRLEPENLVSEPTGLLRVSIEKCLWKPMPTTNWLAGLNMDYYFN